MEPKPTYYFQKYDETTREFFLWRSPKWLYSRMALEARHKIHLKKLMWRTLQSGPIHSGICPIINNGDILCYVCMCADILFYMFALHRKLHCWCICKLNIFDLFTSCFYMNEHCDNWSLVGNKNILLML